MAVLTGADGQMLHGANVLGKVSHSNLIEPGRTRTTCLGDFDRTLSKVSAEQLDRRRLLRPSQHSRQQLPEHLLDITWRNRQHLEQEVTFKMNRFNYPQGGGTFECTGFLTSVSPSVSVGSAQAVTIQFQISGKPTGGF